MDTVLRATTSQLTWVNHWEHFLIRAGFRRMQHRVDPGLYALGNPDEDAPVFVTANYRLSFDALRCSLKDIDGYILVLDTNGINVWCAAGKGTFGTDELVHRIEVTGLSDRVRHRQLILPQLGAPGIAAHEVKKRSKFTVKYGPVRAADLPHYLANHNRATPEMRQVRFNVWDRAIVSGIEVFRYLLPLAVIAILLQFAPPIIGVMAIFVTFWYLIPMAAFWMSMGPLSSIRLISTSVLTAPFALAYLSEPSDAAVVAIVALAAGWLLFPLLLPWIPTRNFSTKGFILGGLVTLPFIFTFVSDTAGDPFAFQLLGIATYLLLAMPLAAYPALNFTGSTTFTSKTGVRQEFVTYLRPMVIMFVLSLFLMITLAIWSVSNV
jgi:hypothetical protein